MSDYASLFLKKFNPCPDRVDSIEKYLLGELDEGLLPELTDHIEKCKRCRRYHGFMESVEKGFKDHELEASEISPLGAVELPSALQTEMIEAMKRNLSKWMFEMGRSIMYRQGMISPLFIDLSEHQPLLLSLNTSSRIARSLKEMRGLSNDDLSQLSHTIFLLNEIQDLHSTIESNKLFESFDICLTFDSKHFMPYFYYIELMASISDIKSIFNIAYTALNHNPPSHRKCSLLNEIARFKYINGDVNESIQLYRRALELYEYPVIYLNLGLAYLNQNKSDDAFIQYQKALQVSDYCIHHKLRLKLRRYCFKHLIYHFNNYKNLISSNENFLNLMNSIG